MYDFAVLFARNFFGKVPSSTNHEMLVVQPNIDDVARQLNSAIVLVPVGASPPLTLFVTPTGIHSKRFSIVDAFTQILNPDPFVMTLWKTAQTLSDGRFAFVKLVSLLTERLGALLNTNATEKRKMQLTITQCLLRSKMTIAGALNFSAEKFGFSPSELQALWTSFLSTRITFELSKHFASKLTNWLRSSQGTPEICARYLLRSDDAIQWGTTPQPVNGLVVATLTRTTTRVSFSGNVVFVKWLLGENDRRSDRSLTRSERRQLLYDLQERVLTSLRAMNVTLVLCNEMPELFSSDFVDLHFYEVCETVEDLAYQLAGPSATVLFVDGIGLRDCFTMPTCLVEAMFEQKRVCLSPRGGKAFVSSLIVSLPGFEKENPLMCEYHHLLKAAIRLLLVAPQGVVMSRHQFFLEAATIVRHTNGPSNVMEAIGECLQRCGEEFANLIGMEALAVLRDDVVIQSLAVITSLFRMELSE